MESFQKTVNTVFRTVLCTVVVVVAMAVALCVLSGLFVPKNNQKAFGMTNQEANGIMGEPKNTIDVLFVGDSEAYSSFSPMQMWNERGFTSYVCATAQQQLPYGNTLLHRATRSQKPKVSSFIGKYLSDAYGLPNHKQDEAYRSWNEAFARYESRIKE